MIIIFIKIIAVFKEIFKILLSPHVAYTHTQSREIRLSQRQGRIKWVMRADMNCIVIKYYVRCLYGWREELLFVKLNAGYAHLFMAFWYLIYFSYTHAGYAPLTINTAFLITQMRRHDEVCIRRAKQQFFNCCHLMIHDWESAYWWAAEQT